MPATMIAAVEDLGNHCDDCFSPLTLPFPVQFYGESYGKAVVSSNGNIQFSPESASHDSTCLPNPTLETAIMLYQGDLDTSGPGEGIFSTTLGTAPDRTFVLEWRTHYAGRQGTSNEELIFSESSSTISMVYGANADDGTGEVSGMQFEQGPEYSQYSCHTPDLIAGRKIIWTWWPPIIICTPTPTRTPTRTPTATPTACVTTVLSNGFETGTLEGYTSVVATCVPGGCGWVNTTTASHLGTRSMFAPDVNDPSDQALTSPPFVVPGGGPLLKFWHRYRLEHPLWDGGELEIKVGSGPWATVTPSTISPPYPPGVIPGSFSNPLVGKQAWTNQNPSWPAFDQVTVGLAAYTGSSVQFRFRLGTDHGNAGLGPALGWWIDDISVTAACSTPTPGPTCTVAPTGMTYWYPLDETTGTTSAELVGAKNGTWHNAPVPNIGQYVLNSLSFNGANQWVDVPGVNSPALGTGNFSIDAWIKVPPSALGATQVFIDNRSWAPRGIEFFIAGGRLGFQMADAVAPPPGYTNYIAPVTNPYPTDGQWHLAAVTVNRATNGGTLTVDAVPVLTFTPRLGTLSGGAPLWLGRHHPNASLPFDLWFTGSLDEVEFFNRALSAGEVAAIYNARQYGKCKSGIPPATPTPHPCNWCYSDVPLGSTFYPYVSYLAYQGVISGYADGTFRPFNNITRGQIAKVVANAAGFSETPSGQTFTDVPTTNPFYVWIEQMAGRGIIAGYTCGGPNEPCDAQRRPYFRPGSDATRAQLAKIVVLAATYPDVPSGQTFSDVPTTHPFYVWIEVMAGRSIISGYNCGSPGEPCDPANRPYFRPYNSVTRGQGAKIVRNTFAPDCDALPAP
ncbi:MAG TPA: S-layer homology domain-containing protein [Chloroflexia bacterium]|nr:S-layer homology domain-containing protein [Chloroflexia bacterium]